jgi:rare lipoprotein A
MSPLRSTPLLRSLLALVALAGLSAAPALAQSAEIAETEQGRAVRYDTGATGQATASGEPYNPERMTLAHPTLPFGTLVEVVNEANGQHVTARVNDRVPPTKALRVRISARAADQLGLTARGGTVTLRLDEDEIAYLRVQAMREKERALRAESTAASEVEGRGFTVQIASFSDEARAMAKADELRGAWVLPVTVGSEVVYRVCYGVFATSERASVSEASLRQRGIEGFVKSLDAPPMRSASLDGG